jgi:hypothetical protein
MAKWEYAIVSLYEGQDESTKEWRWVVSSRHKDLKEVEWAGWRQIEEGVNEMGEQGWELMCSQPLEPSNRTILLFFKRPKE